MERRRVTGVRRQLQSQVIVAKAILFYGQNLEKLDFFGGGKCDLEFQPTEHTISPPSPPHSLPSPGESVVPSPTPTLFCSVSLEVDHY